MVILSRGLAGAVARACQQATHRPHPVPAHPALVAVLRDLIKRDGLQPGDLFFPGEKGGLLAGSVFCRAWNKARKAVSRSTSTSHPWASVSTTCATPA